MISRLNRATALRLALVAAAAVSVTACKTAPKPQYSTTPTAPTQERTTPPPVDTGPSTGPVSSQVLPGSQQDFVVNVGDRVYFDTDSHDVRDDARGILTAQAGWLRQYPAVRVRIEGNADERGTREYNLALGARRANSVRDFLASPATASRRSRSARNSRWIPAPTKAPGRRTAMRGPPSWAAPGKS
jgi:peptidoglycan-associated lipoprotein